MDKEKNKKTKHDKKKKKIKNYSKRDPWATCNDNRMFAVIFTHTFYDCCSKRMLTSWHTWFYFGL